MILTNYTAPKWRSKVNGRNDTRIYGNVEGDPICTMNYLYSEQGQPLREDDKSNTFIIENAPIFYEISTALTTLGWRYKEVVGDDNKVYCSWYDSDNNNVGHFLKESNSLVDMWVDMRGVYNIYAKLHNANACDIPTQLTNSGENVKGEAQPPAKLP